VGRRITALEDALGARLLLRTPERLQATAAGLKLVPRAERMEAEALELECDLQAADGKLEGSLRVTAPDGFVQYVLLPALPHLRREHPVLFLEIRSDLRALDLSRREADVAVRLFRPKEPALVARRLGEAVAERISARVHEGPCKPGIRAEDARNVFAVMMRPAAALSAATTNRARKAEGVAWRSLATPSLRLRARRFFDGNAGAGATAR
jgi:DNA-binding transcriptional LysR family regulator